MKKMMKIKESIAFVREKMETIEVKNLRHVIALTGCNNAGKTSVLKCLIAELYRRNPQGWIGRSKFNPDRVDITRKNVEYHAVFSYKGVLIAIRTAGDTKDVIVKNFEYFDKHKVAIGITAVRVHEKGKEDVVAEHAYMEVKSMRDFENHNIPILCKKLRTRDEEMEVVKDIITELDKIIDNIENQNKEQMEEIHEIALQGNTVLG